MALSDYFPDMKGWQAVGPQAQPTPQIPDHTTQVSPYLRATLPLPLQYSPDTLKQYNRPGLSSFRFSPLPPNGMPTINSAASSVTKIINNTTGGSGILLKTDGVTNPNQQVLDITGGTNVTAVSDSSGRVTISAAGSSGFFTSRPDYKRWSLWTQSGNGAGIGGGYVGVCDTLVSYQSGTTSYSLVSATSTDDFGVKLQEGTTSGAFASIVGQQTIIPARDFSMFCPVRIATNSGNIRVWVILSNPNNSGDASAIATSDTPNRDIVGFRYNPAISTNWFAVMAKVGVGLTATDTGVAATTSGTMLRVDYDAASTTATYFIDGVQVATINTNPPTITFQLGGMVSVASTGAGTNALNISSFYTEMRTTVTTN